MPDAVRPAQDQCQEGRSSRMNKRHYVNGIEGEMSQKTTVLPCPFCGGEASDTGHIKWSRPLTETTWADGSPITEAFFCNCISCGISNQHNGLGHRTQSEAREAWNKRPGNAALPADIVAALISIGRSDWAATAAKSDEEHTKGFANSLRLTREHFNTEGEQELHGVYVKNSGTVICHTGTSPNSAIHAQILTGAWNWMLGIATAQGGSA